MSKLVCEAYCCGVPVGCSQVTLLFLYLNATERAS